MEQQVFSDGIGQVTIIGGVVRLDLVAFSPTEKDAKGQPAAVLCQRVIMSVDGFMQSAAKIQEAAQAISKLAQRGREDQPGAQAAPAQTVPAQTTPVQAAPPPAKPPFP